MLYLDYDKEKSKDKTALVLVLNSLSSREKTLYFIFHDIPQDTESAEILIRSLAKIKTMVGFRRFYYWLKNGKKRPADEHFETYESEDGREGVAVENMRLKDFERVYIKNLKNESSTIQMNRKEEKIEMELVKGGWTIIDEGYVWIDPKKRTTTGLYVIKTVEEGEE